MSSKWKGLLFFAAAVMVTFSFVSLAALAIPEKPNGYVTDLAGLLSPSEKAQLEDSLASYEAETTHQILFLSLPSLEGEVLEDTAIRTAEKWKPGQKGRDNGVLVLIAAREQAIRIEVGYGLEPYLTDLKAGRIIRDIMVPHFRARNPALAIQAGVSAIQQTIAGADLPELAQEGMADGDKTLLKGVRWVLICMAVLFSIDLARYGVFFAVRRGDQKKYSFLEWFFIFSLLLAVLSILFKIFLHIAVNSRGGYYGSGRGSSRGGFSGGGGSFGGGGASGRW